MERSHLVGSVGANEHQVRYISPGYQIADEMKRRHVQPLQVIDEENEGPTRAGKGSDQPPEGDTETVQSILRRQIRQRRLSADDWLQRRNEIRHQMAIRSDGLGQRSPPGCNLVLVIGEYLTEQRSEGLGQGCIGYALCLHVEFADRYHSLVEGQTGLKLRYKR